MKRKAENIEDALLDVVLLKKPEGWTPLQAIKKFKEEHPLYRTAKMSYAGRLDPMAHETVKKQKEYELSKKVYEFEALFGVQTDSYDILGIPKLFEGQSQLPSPSSDLEEQVKALMPKFTGKHKQKYPPYSSIRVQSKFLFQWAKEGRLDEIEIPTNEVEIPSLKILKSYDIDVHSLSKTIPQRISRVTSGDFRQEIILKAWKDLLSDQDPQRVLRVIRFEAQVSPGTYVRSLVHEMGQQLGLGALAFEICRTRAGTFDIADAFTFSSTESSTSVLESV